MYRRKHGGGDNVRGPAYMLELVELSSAKISFYMHAQDSDMSGSYAFKCLHVIACR